MRPHPSEVITGALRILREVVEPELQSPYARMLVRELSSVLKAIDWDNAGLKLEQANLTQHETLARLAAWVANDANRCGLFADFTACFAALPPAPATSVSYSDHVIYEHALAQVSIAAIAPLTDWLASHPDDQESDSIPATAQRELLRGRLKAPADTEGAGETT